jgi:hypothetical protein
MDVRLCEHHRSCRSGLAIWALQKRNCTFVPAADVNIAAGTDHDDARAFQAIRKFLQLQTRGNAQCGDPLVGSLKGGWLHDVALGGGLAGDFHPLRRTRGEHVSAKGRHYNARQNQLSHATGLRLALTTSPDRKCSADFARGRLI